MHELVRTNNAVVISAIEALLKEAGIACLVLDQNMSVLEGSIGILARRIVCRVHEGQVLERGERVGLMKFGSRMDVFLPTDATLRVGVGDRVIGGETVLASLGSDRAR